MWEDTNALLNNSIIVLGILFVGHNNICSSSCTTVTSSLSDEVNNILAILWIFC